MGLILLSNKVNTISSRHFTVRDEINIINILIVMRNNILGAVVYLSTAIVFGGSTALLMLFIKENSDRCHYYNGKWNKADLLCGVAAICAGMVVNHYLLRL